MGVLDVKYSDQQELTLEWESSSSNDMVADSTLALINGIDRSPASVKCELVLYSICPLLKELQSDDRFAFALALRICLFTTSSWRSRRLIILCDKNTAFGDVSGSSLW